MLQWNLNFALLPLISQWEFTRNLTAAAAALPMLQGATDWWACYLEKVRSYEGFAMGLLFRLMLQLIALLGTIF